MRRSLGRRAFLKGAAAVVATAGSLGRWLATPARGAHAEPLPPVVEVLVEDLALGPRELAQGHFERVAATPRGVTLPPRESRGAYTSPALKASFPVTHVGLHWRASTPAGSGLALAVRSSSDGVAWSAWREVLIEAHAPEGASETYGALVSTERGHHLQFRASFVAGEGAPLLERATLTLLNSKDGPRLPRSAVSQTATTALTGPPITFTREDWGADERLRFRGNREIWPRMYVPTKKAVVHHTVTTNDYATAEDAKAEVRAIYTYHARTLGWGDIGYNALVDQLGNSYEGRYGREQKDDPAGSGYGGPNGREVLSEDVVAGHAAHHNYGSTGLALLGTFCTPQECGGGAAPSEPMVAKLKELLVWECRKHEIDQKEATDYLLSNNEWNRRLVNVCGHRDCNATICPGGQVYTLLASLRQQVADALASSAAPTVALTASPPEGTSTDGQASYAWDASGGAGGYTYSSYLEGWHKASSSDDITYLSGFTGDKQPQWSDWTAATAASYSGLKDGHYTFHVRAKDAQGAVTVYQDNRTLLMANSGGGGGGRRPR